MDPFSIFNMFFIYPFLNLLNLSYFVVHKNREGVVFKRGFNKRVISLHRSFAETTYLLKKNWGNGDSGYIVVWGMSG